jgi:hypothetical protein
MTAPEPIRELRECDGCHQVDDQPHHQVVVPGDDGLMTVGRHFACCAAAGCPDGTCDAMTGAQSGV